MATGRGGNKIKTRLGFLLYGDYGTWKSSFCLESMKLVNEDGRPFRVLFIDPENGGVDTYLDKYEEEGYDLRNIYIVYTQSLTEVEDFIKKAKNNEDFYEFDDDGNKTDEVYLDADGNPFRPDMIVVDGATLLYTAKQQSIIEFSKKRATVKAKRNELTGMDKEVAIEGAGMELKDWNTLKFDGQNLILDLLACGKHFAVTAREKAETDSFKDKDNTIKMVRTGRFIPDGFKDVGYNCKTVIRMFKDTDGIIKGLIDNKDRTLIHQQNEIVIEPSILDWQAAITKNKGKKDFIVQNNMDAAISKELKEVEKDNAKFDAEFDEKAVPTNVASGPKTIAEYQDAIKSAITNLTPVEKSKKQTAIVEAGLPKAYQKLTDIDQLKKYYEIVTR
jgi:hypothetical protein